jgi:hypothetical protein
MTALAPWRLMTRLAAPISIVTGHRTAGHDGDRV